MRKNAWKMGHNTIRMKWQIDCFFFFQIQNAVNRMQNLRSDRRQYAFDNWAHNKYPIPIYVPEFGERANMEIGRHTFIGDRTECLKTCSNIYSDGNLSPMFLSVTLYRPLVFRCECAGPKIKKFCVCHSRHSFSQSSSSLHTYTHTHMRSTISSRSSSD